MHQNFGFRFLTLVGAGNGKKIGSTEFTKAELFTEYPSPIDEIEMLLGKFPNAPTQWKLGNLNWQTLFTKQTDRGFE